MVCYYYFIRYVVRGVTADEVFTYSLRFRNVSDEIEKRIYVQFTTFNAIFSCENLILKYF